MFHVLPINQAACGISFVEQFPAGEDGGGVEVGGWIVKGRESVVAA